MTPPFLQVAEIWAPEPTDTFLELVAGSYGPHHEFRATSRDRQYARGEGLPGRIWSTGQATVLNHFRGGSGFQRAEAAERARLGAGLGLPILHGGRTVAVVVLLCGEATFTPGALEVWGQEDGDTLKLQSGYYGDFDSFRRLSAAVRFERGAGLPGRAWSSQLPELLPNVSLSDSFIRAAAALSFDLTTGLSWPCYGTTPSIAVMLGTKSTPIARGVEVWVPADKKEDKNTLVLRAAEYRDVPPVMALEPGATVRSGEGFLGQAYVEGMPQVIESADGFDSRTRHAFACGINRGIVIPIIAEDSVRAVLALYS
jgi:hypothetical protein